MLKNITATVDGRVTNAYIKANDLADQGLTVIKNLVKSQIGAVGTAQITGLFITGMLAFVLYIVIANFWPTAQTANTAIQANTATDAGTTTSKTFFNIGLWLIVVGVFVALFVMLIKKISGK
jgi:hypothetical protein